MNVSKRFFPEHGLICAYSVAKIDCPFEEAIPPSIVKNSLRAPTVGNNAIRWWSPEIEIAQPRAWMNGIFDGTAGTASNTYYTHAFQDLMCGYNTSTWDTAATNIGMVLNDNTPSVAEYQSAYDGDDLFSGDNAIFQGNFANMAGQSVKPGFICTLENKLFKHSPVHPNPNRKPML